MNTTTATALLDKLADRFQKPPVVHYILGMDNKRIPLSEATFNWYMESFPYFKAMVTLIIQTHNAVFTIRNRIHLS